MYISGEYTVPEDQIVVLFQGSILTDEKYWENALDFIPDRFLENGKYMTTRPNAFIPFGYGRRVCVGEKLAIADLFLVLVRFLQSTNDYNIISDSYNGIEPDPEVVQTLSTKPYKICFTKNNF